MKFQKTLLISTLLLALSACKSPNIKDFAPEYTQPTVNIPETFVYDVPKADESPIQASSLGWKDYFADPRLHALIELVLKNNTDLRLANLNVEQIKVQYGIQQKANLPNINGSGNASYNRNNHGYSIGISTAYELDLWSKIKNDNEAVLQQYLATAAARDSTHLSLIANVAKAYFAELAATASIKLSERTLATRQETYRLSQLKFKAGVISALDLRAQEAAIETAKASYANAVKNQEQARNAIAMLIAQPIPENLPKGLPLNKQFKIRNLPAGLSSNLLRNRPDIRAAENNLRAANANIGAARAAFYPSIRLTGNAGIGSSDLTGLFKLSNRSWSFVPSISVPIFDWGINQANLEAKKIAQQKTIVAYESAVQSAFREVADALVARAALNSEYQSEQAQAQAYAERLRLTHLRYKHGVSNALDLLDAERSSYGAESSILATETSLANNLADLYKVLGGGLKRLTTDAQEEKQLHQNTNSKP